MEPFADAVSRALEVRGLSREQLADGLGLVGTTLRTWLSSNRLPLAQAVRIAQALGLAQDLAQLEERYSLGFTQSHAATRIVDRASGEGLDAIDAHWRRAADPDLASGLRRLLDALQPGDCYVHCALDRLPVELQANGWAAVAASYAAAFERGVHFCYVHADRATVELLSRTGWSGLHLPETWETRLTALRQQLADRLGTTDDHGLDAARIYRVPAPLVAFAAPGQAQVLVRSAGPRPFRAYTLLANASGALYVPLDAASESQLHHVVERALRALNIGLHHILQPQDANERPPEPTTPSVRRREAPRPKLSVSSKAS